MMGPRGTLALNFDHPGPVWGGRQARGGSGDDATGRRRQQRRGWPQRGFEPIRRAIRQDSGCCGSAQHAQSVASWQKPGRSRPFLEPGPAPLAGAGQGFRVDRRPFRERRAVPEAPRWRRDPSPDPNWSGPGLRPLSKPLVWRGPGHGWPPARVLGDAGPDHRTPSRHINQPPSGGIGSIGGVGEPARKFLLEVVCRASLGLLRQARAIPGVSVAPSSRIRVVGLPCLIRLEGKKFYILLAV